MNIRNLDKEDVVILDNVIAQMQNVNSNITCKTFIQGEELKISNSERLEILEQKIDRVIGMIDRIFGNVIFINGRFKQL